MALASTVGNGGGFKPKLLGPATPRTRWNKEEGNSGYSSRGTAEFGYIPLEGLRPHPLNLKLYGSGTPDAKLIASIEADGILEPLLVAMLSFDGGEHYDTYIISGHRRWLAAQHIAKKHHITNPQIPIRSLGLSVAEDLSHLDYERRVIESNRQRVKTAEQKAREFKELKRIEAALAKERKLAGLKKGEKAPVGTESASTGKAATKAAQAVGLGRDTAAKLEKLVDAADAGDAKAKEALADIDSKKGRGVDSAFKNVFVPTPTEPLTPIPNAWDILVKDDRPERLGQVGKLVALFKNSDLRGAVGTSAVSDPVPDTLNRFNLTVHCDAATLKTIRNVVGSAPAVKFMGLTARQVELIAEACSVKADKEKIA